MISYLLLNSVVETAMLYPDEKYPFRDAAADYGRCRRVSDASDSCFVYERVVLDCVGQAMGALKCTSACLYVSSRRSQF